jgi:hypothetical protein
MHKLFDNKSRFSQNFRHVIGLLLNAVHVNGDKSSTEYTAFYANSPAIQSALNE